MEGLLERIWWHIRHRVGRKPGLEQGLMATVLIELLEALAGVVSQARAICELVPKPASMLRDR